MAELLQWLFLANCLCGTSRSTDGAKNLNDTVNKNMQVQVLLLIEKLVGQKIMIFQTMLKYLFKLFS